MAEDEHALRTFLHAILLESGYRVIVAADGAEALAKAKAHQEAIHLLLSDIEMPGTTGIEVARQLARDRPETRILLMSGHPPATTVPGPPWSLLRKPFTAEALLAQIRSALA